MKKSYNFALCYTACKRFFVSFFKRKNKGGRTLYKKYEESQNSAVAEKKREWNWLLAKHGSIGRVNIKAGEMYLEKLNLFQRFICYLKSLNKF